MRWRCTGNIAINTNKFTVTAASGNTLVSGTLDVTGNFVINTNKFNITAASGNTAIAGDLAIATNKFTVAASSGNTAIAGTLAVAGNCTLTGTLTVGGLAVTGKVTDYASADVRNGRDVHNPDRMPTATNSHGRSRRRWRCRQL